MEQINEECIESKRKQLLEVLQNKEVEVLEYFSHCINWIEEVDNW